MPPADSGALIRHTTRRDATVTGGGPRVEMATAPGTVHLRDAKSPQGPGLRPGRLG